MGAALRSRVRNVVNAAVRTVSGLRRPSKGANARRLNERGEPVSSLVIRDVVEADIPALAALHVKTWNQTYPHVRRPPTRQLRESQWREQFKATDGGWFCLVVQNRAGELVGFAKGVAQRSDRSQEPEGQLSKIYLLREYQRLGLGRRLLGDVARRFLAMGVTRMVLFGVPQNPSCRFHEAMGGERLLAENGDFHGGYEWRDLQRLASRCPVD